MTKLNELEMRVRILEDDIQELQDDNEPIGFYNFAELWLKWYPTDLTQFFPGEVNYISKYFEKVLNDKKERETKEQDVSRSCPHWKMDINTLNDGVWCCDKEWSIKREQEEDDD